MRGHASFDESMIRLQRSAQSITIYFQHLRHVEKRSDNHTRHSNVTVYGSDNDRSKPLIPAVLIALNRCSAVVTT